MKNYPQKTKVSITGWTAQRPDLMWGKQKTKDYARSPSNLNAFERLGKEEWTGIAQAMCVRLVENYKKLLQAVIQQNGYTTY